MESWRQFLLRHVEILLQEVLLLLHTYCASLMFCYFLCWEEPIKPESVVGVNAGSAGTKNRGRKALLLLKSHLGHGASEGFPVALRSCRECRSLSSSTAAAPEQGTQPVSPTQTSACRQEDLCTGLAESSATRPIQKSPWSSKQAGGCPALTDSCWPGSGLLKMSVFILSCTCCMCLSAVSLQCGKGIYLSVFGWFFSDAIFIFFASLFYPGAFGFVLLV